MRKLAECPVTRARHVANDAVKAVAFMNTFLQILGSLTCEQQVWASALCIPPLKHLHSLGVCVISNNHARKNASVFISRITKAAFHCRKDLLSL
jgi:hypothetical protein